MLLDFVTDRARTPATKLSRRVAARRGLKMRYAASVTADLPADPTERSLVVDPRASIHTHELYCSVMMGQRLDISFTELAFKPDKNCAEALY